MTEPQRTRDLLKKLEFEEVWGTMTDQEPAYRYDFGNLQLTATQVMSLRFFPVFVFGGVWGDGRSLVEVAFEMPLEVASFEQGVAWITHGIGKGFHPHKACQWVMQGRGWQDQLPWIRRIKMYEARPQCTVDREWFKVATKKLYAVAATANEGDLAVFDFDGEILRIKVCSYTAAMPGRGKKWVEQYTIKAQQLDFLPKRLMRSTVHLSVWEDHLSIDNRSWRLVGKPTQIQCNRL